MDAKEILDNPMVSQIVFYPKKTGMPKEVPSKFRIMQFEIENGVTIGGILFLADDYLHKPTMLFFHGNGEVATDYSYLANKYIELDINFAVFDYRGYGFSTGTPIYSALFSDPLIIYKKFNEWIEKEYDGICSKKFVLMGRSLGSSCAASLGGFIK